MKYKIVNCIKNGDLVPNIIDTYPKFILDMKNNKVYDEDAFYMYLYQNNVSFIAYHCTRLTEYEVNEIKNNGMKRGGKELLRKKIMNLPDSCSDFKDELISYIEELPATHADFSIYASYGKLDLKEDKACDKIFTENWGGESIYNYYDNSNTYKVSRLQLIKNTLHLISKPYILILRCPPDVDAALSQKYYYKNFMEEKIENIYGSICIENFIPEVIDIVDLTKYSGLDYSLLTKN